MAKHPDFSKRGAILRSALERHGMRGAILSHPKHVFYFTGVLPGLNPCLLVVLPQKSIVVAPSQFGDLETILYVDYDIHQGWDVYRNCSEVLGKAVAPLISDKGVLGLDINYFPATFMQAIQGPSMSFRNIGGILWEMQKIKEPDEIERIQANVSVLDKTFETVKQVLKPGMKELDLWGVIYQTICTLNGQAVHLEGDLGGGLRGVDLGAQPTNEQLEKGDALFIDIYTSMHGYYADTTRVFALGEPTPKQREVHAILEEALAAGEDALRPGILANQVDEIVRKAVAKHGYGDNFPHHTGHNYGLFQQERPYIIPAETIPLEAGMIVALEPGIYLPGWGGMRLEGNYLIENGGARRLDHYPSQLTVCA